MLRELLLRKTFADPWDELCQTYDSGCVHKAIIEAQRVGSGRAVIDLLRHSERVEADLVLGQCFNSGDASTQLVLRKWAEVGVLRELNYS